MKKTLLVLILACITLNSQTLDSLKRMADSLAKGQHYELAIPIAEQIVLETEKAFGQKDTNYANSLFKLGVYHQNLHSNEVAESLYTIVVELRRELSGEKSLGYINCIENLGVLYATENIGDSAQSYLQRAAQLRLQTQGEDHPDYESSLFKMANACRKFGNYPEAESLLHRSLKLISKNSGEHNLTYASRLNNLGALYILLQRYDLAEQYTQQSIALKKELSKEETTDFVSSLNNLATIYTNTGRYDMAETMHKKCLELRGKINGVRSTEYARSLNNLGVLYATMGRMPEAEAYYRATYEIREAVLGSNSIEMADVLLNLGDIFLQTNRILEAESVLKKASEIYAVEYGENHPDLLNCNLNLSVLYRTMGKMKESRQLLERNLKILTEAGMDTSDIAAQTYFNLANLTIESGDTVNGIQLQWKAMEMQKKILGENHSDYAASLANIATIAMEQNRYLEADSLLQQAEKITRSAGANVSLNYSLILGSMANLAIKRGRYDDARRLQAQSVQIQKESTGDGTIDYANTLVELGSVLRHTHFGKASDSCFVQADRVLTNIIGKYFPAMSEQERSQYWRRINRLFGEFYSHVLWRYSENPSLLVSLFNNRLRNKAIMFNSMKRQREIIESSQNDTLKSKYHLLVAIRKRIGESFSNSSDMRSANSGELDSLINEAAELEVEIGRMLQSKTPERGLGYLNFKDIAANLNRDEAVVELVRFPIHTINGIQDSICYLGLIVTNETKEHPIPVVLNNGKSLETIIFDAYQKQIVTGNERRNTEIYNAYWGRFEKHLIGKRRIYLSQDGVYNKINILSLKNPATKKYLLSEKDVIIVTNSSDVLKGKNKAIGAHETGRAELFGDPNFERVDTVNSSSEISENKLLKESADVQRSLLLTTNSAKRIVLNNLPGTRVEVEEISQLLKDNHIPIAEYIGDSATEDAIKQIRNPRVLHLATHGAFLTEEQAKIKQFRQGETELVVENPLLRSMLFFAGAERTLSGGRDALEQTEDGVLTAYEAMNLYLQNTELVVLSACQSGVGEINNGEGVYGMQRAFQTAGARYVLMSLWNVNDNSTSELMQSFYRNWTNGKTIPVAFKLAQEEIKKKYPQPFFWGAFVLVGQ